MPRNHNQKVKYMVEKMYKFQANSKHKGKSYPQDLIIARKMLEEYHSILTQLNEMGYRVHEGSLIKL